MNEFHELVGGTPTPPLGEPEQIIPVFVLGSPRSGTTLMGNYVSSAPSLFRMGEFSGFYLTHRVLPGDYAGVPSRVKHDYLHLLQWTTMTFARTVTAAAGCRYFCDSTPWNLMAASELARLPEARFVLMVRRHEGVVDSLRRSRGRGYGWAGDSETERVDLWRRFYEQARHLPPDRTLALSYDRLCSAPRRTLGTLHAGLRRLGIDALGFDERELCRSHATATEDRRPTIGHCTSQGTVRLHPIRGGRDRPPAGAGSTVTATYALLESLYPGLVP
jgi:Sulfotransferase family